MNRRVVIVGGGLAGLGLGIALRRHAVPVAIHEAGRYPRHRVCGEFITALDNQTKLALGISECLRDAHTASGVTWCEDGQSDIGHRLPQPALCLSRHALDLAMAETFRALGGELLEGSRVSCPDEPGFVDAAGRQPDPRSPWVGVKQHFRNVDLRNDLEVHFGRGGYIGLTRVEKLTVNVCGLLRRGCADLTATLPEIARQSGFRSLAERLDRAKPVKNSFCATAGLNYQAQSARDAILRIGDRLSLVPPFTGHGMTIALQSAAAALSPVLLWASGRITWEDACRLATAAQLKRFGMRLRMARAIHPVLLDPRARGLARMCHRMGVLPVSLLYRVMH